MNRSELRASEVAIFLADGCKREEIIEIFGKKWQISFSSIDKIIMLARPKVAEIIQKRNAAIEQAITAKLQKLSEERVLTKQRKREVLADIVEGRHKSKRQVLVDHQEWKDGTHVKTKKKVTLDVMPDAHDIINAIEVDNAMSGDNAPIKQQHAHVLIPISGTTLER